MTKHKKEDCVQNTSIALLKEQKDTMAGHINDIKEDVKDLKDDFKEIKEFILTSPQKFADKDEFQKFKDGVNYKLIFATGGITAILYLLDKFV